MIDAFESVMHTGVRQPVKASEGGSIEERAGRKRHPTTWCLSNHTARLKDDGGYRRYSILLVSASASRRLILAR
ncbi:MAG: hypothetical protein QOH50_5348 [Kribbellaceae bacterium]|nr:hypothetical protein [Kribbellaceae bacterium]